MTLYKQWEIWEADVPFEDTKDSKKRPVLILSDETVAVLSVKMTSHAPRYKTLPGEYEIVKWKESGLLRPTVIQCSKVIRLPKEKMRSKNFGKLQASDILGMKVMLKYMNININRK